jgi:phosphate-selective porin OprO/OprP
VEYRAGLRTSDTEGEVRWRFNGRLMLDALEAQDTLAEDGQEVRRARILAQGTIGNHLGARLQWDLSDSEEELLEGMLDWRTCPLGTLRLGHFREPFGLNARTSSAYLSFLERSSPTDAFTAGRNRGAQLSRRGPRWSLAAGLFRDADRPFPGDGLGEGRAATARATWLPVRTEEDARLLHLGLSASLRDPNSDGLRLAADPGSNLIGPLVDTGSLPARNATVVGLEAAWIDGPRSAQAEVFLSEIDLPGPDGSPWGVSVQGSYFLTGERRTYRDSTSSFGPPVVHRPVFGGGPGAWELAARWSRTDLDEGAVAGGTMQDLTLGVNWYLSPHARLMLDYLDARVEGPGDQGQALMVRLHLGF